MDDSSYDESCRYLADRAGATLMHWLLRLDAGRVGFDSWRDPVLTWPGVKERICDMIAQMVDLERGGVPFAAIVEFQTEPDPRMFGRLLVAGGLCWLKVKPTDLPGDRYELCAVVVNLTGQGDCARHMVVGTAEWKLTPREVNLATLDAGSVLDEIVAGTAPGEILAWIPLMKNGDDDAIIGKWLEIGGQESNPARRGDYALAAVFAEAVGRQDLWRKVVEELKMKEPSIVLEWKAKARREGEIQGEIKMLLFALQDRFGALPEDLVARIRASAESEPFERWMGLAMKVPTLDQFRQDAGLEA